MTGGVFTGGFVWIGTVLIGETIGGFDSFFGLLPKKSANSSCLRVFVGAGF